MLPLKAVVVTATVVVFAVMLRLSLPVIQTFLTSDLPYLWSVIISWLRPPYLYLLVNSIIITIVASSKLHNPRTTTTQQQTEPERVTTSAPEVSETEEERERSEEVVLFGFVEKIEEEVKEKGENDGFVHDSAKASLSKRESGVEVDKPPVSARFGHRKNSVKASPEGKSLRKVTRPRRQDTLESTWRTITEGRPIPLTRHLKKSDTFAGVSQGVSVSESPTRVMKKSDTFGGGSLSPASSGGSGGIRVRREPSLSQDELNKRVEAFINKFNEDMRLQRLESLRQYKEKVNRGAH